MKLAQSYLSRDDLFSFRCCFYLDELLFIFMVQVYSLLIKQNPEFKYPHLVIHFCCRLYIFISTHLERIFFLRLGCTISGQIIPWKFDLVPGLVFSVLCHTSPNCSTLFLFPILHSSDISLNRRIPLTFCFPLMTFRTLCYLAIQKNYCWLAIFLPTETPNTSKVIVFISHQFSIEGYRRFIHSLPWFKTSLTGLVRLSYSYFLSLSSLTPLVAPKPHSLHFSLEAISLSFSSWLVIQCFPVLWSWANLFKICLYHVMAYPNECSSSFLDVVRGRVQCSQAA